MAFNRASALCRSPCRSLYCIPFGVHAILCGGVSQLLGYSKSSLSVTASRENSFYLVGPGLMVVVGGREVGCLVCLGGGRKGGGERGGPLVLKHVCLFANPGVKIEEGLPGARASIFESLWNIQLPPPVACCGFLFFFVPFQICVSGLSATWCITAPLSLPPSDSAPPSLPPARR